MIFLLNIIFESMKARMQELRDEISRMELERQDWEDPTNQIRI